MLTRDKLASSLDFDRWITEDYIRAAYADAGRDYEAEKAKIVDPFRANAGLPNEVWHSRDGILKYATVSEVLKGVAGFQATGSKLNATYVYDHVSGLKLFGKTAFYVRKPNCEFLSFLRRGEAEAVAGIIIATSRGKCKYAAQQRSPSRLSRRQGARTLNGFYCAASRKARPRITGGSWWL